MRSKMQGLPAQLKLVGEVLRTNSVIEADSRTAWEQRTPETKGRSFFISETTQNKAITESATILLMNFWGRFSKRAL